jgi:type I restriction enzyme M protein
MTDRTHKELLDDDIRRISDTYHAWRGEADAGAYEAIPGFCASALLAQIREYRFVLTPGRYVGSEEPEDDGEPMSEKLPRLRTALLQAFEESDQIQQRVREALGLLDV